jgi:hypothetical protein
VLRRDQKINDDIANFLTVELFAMKELFSSLSATVLYPLVSLILPGLTAVSGWFVLFAQRPPLLGLVSRNHTETAFVLMLAAIFAGTVIDDLGMRIERGWLDARRERRTGGLHGEEWWAYLRKPLPAEPSGRRHLRRLVVRLKFELGVPIGLTVTAPALWLNPALSGSWAALLTTFAVGLSAYLFFEAAATHNVLGRLRHELLKDEGTACAMVPRKTVQSA